MEPLVEIAEDLVELLEAHIEQVGEQAEPAEKLVAADAVCTYYQGVAICELLLDAEVDAFFHHMIRSAQTRRWALSLAAPLAEECVPDVMGAANTRGLFAASLARQWALAAEIARLSPVEVRRDAEFEDDFCYARFLHLHLTGGKVPEKSAVLSRFGEALEGAESPRLDLCNGLLAGDAKACAAAFEALLEERSAWVEKTKRTALSGDSLFRPFSAIYVEGLAWLAILERAGYEMERDYPFCPSLARAREYAPFEVTTFPATPL